VKKMGEVRTRFVVSFHAKEVHTAELDRRLTSRGILNVGSRTFVHRKHPADADAAATSAPIGVHEQPQLRIGSKRLEHKNV
jgi:hypothetical protein